MPVFFNILSSVSHFVFGSDPAVNHLYVDGRCLCACPCALGGPLLPCLESAVYSERSLGCFFFCPVTLCTRLRSYDILSCSFFLQLLFVSVMFIFVVRWAPVLLGKRRYPPRYQHRIRRNNRRSVCMHACAFVFVCPCVLTYAFDVLYTPIRCGTVIWERAFGTLFWKERLLSSLLRMNEISWNFLGRLFHKKRAW